MNIIVLIYHTMMFFKKEVMWVFIYLLVGIFIGTDGSLEDGACCTNGSILVSPKPGIQFCRNEAANVSAWTHLKCNNTVMIIPQSDIGMNVEGGKLFLSLAYDNVAEYEPDTFCVGVRVVKRNGTKINKRALVFCNDLNDVPIISDLFKGIAAVISAIFLLATSLIYASLAELRDLLGKSIVNLCTSLAIGLILLAAMSNLEYEDMNLCAARGFFMYFFFMASFFWMNAIAVQILLSTRRPTISIFGWKEFAWYALYAWGCPALLTIVMAIVNYVPGTHQRPGIGFNKCWFYDVKLQWQYMYSVMTLLYLVNIGIFIYTSVILWKQKLNSDHKKAMKFKLGTTFRLFIVMGIPWGFEMIESLFPSHIIWEIIDVLNLLEGLFIFLMLVVFRKRVIKLMHKRGWLDCMSGPVEKWLAVAEDQEDVVQHTVGISMDDTNKIKN